MYYALRHLGGLRWGYSYWRRFGDRWRHPDNFLLIIGWRSKLHHLRFNAQASPELLQGYRRFD